VSASTGIDRVRCRPGCTERHPYTPCRTASEPRALPARQEVHLDFHGVTAEDVAAIIERETP
jgi:hypothetical protein